MILLISILMLRFKILPYIYNFILLTLINTFLISYAYFYYEINFISKFELLSLIISLHYFFFHFFNMIKTSRRINLLFQIYYYNKIKYNLDYEIEDRQKGLDNFNLLSTKKNFFSYSLTIIAYIYHFMKWIYKID